MDLPIHWLERWVNHEQSNQAVYLLACGDSKLDEVHTYLFTDLRPVHVLQNTWCARPASVQHAYRPLCCAQVCHVMISVTSCNIGRAALAGDIKI